MCRDESAKWETIELSGLDEEQRFCPAALISRKMEYYASLLDEHDPSNAQKRGPRAAYIHEGPNNKQTQEK